jgi:hypothetical protein
MPRKALLDIFRTTNLSLVNRAAGGIWHLDILVQDHHEWSEFLCGVSHRILASLPRRLKDDDLDF